jgi:hypothetical protein
MLFNDGVNFEDYTVPVKSKLLKEKPILVPLFLPQIPKGLAWEKTWVSTVRGR